MSKYIIIKEGNIDLKELITLFKDKFKYVIAITSMTIAVGLVVAFTSQKQYTSSVTLLVESGSSDKSGMGNLSSLAGLAGLNINLGNGGAGLDLNLYPQIVKSTIFQKEIVKEPIKFQNPDTAITYFQYATDFAEPGFVDLIKKYTIGLPRTLISYFKVDPGAIVKKEKRSDVDYLNLSAEEQSIINSLSSRILVDFDPQTSLLVISCTLPDKLASAELTAAVVQKLTESVQEYKLKKEVQNLTFIKEQYEEVKKRYFRDQSLFADFADRNFNLTSTQAQIQFDQLRDQKNISYELYKGLASQLESAKLKVEKESMVFSVIEPIKVPLEKSSPKRSLILAISLSLGLIAAVIYILYKFSTISLK